jgi:hypothetical protein
VSDNTPTHELSPTAKLAELQAAYDARNAAPAPPDKPTDAAGARAKLDALTADKSWSERYLKGGVNEAREFKELTAMVASADPATRLERVLAGEIHNNSVIETVSGDELSTSKLAIAVEGLREVGISDEAIKEAVNGGRNNAVIHRATQELKTRLFSDQAWVKKYLEGGAAERKQATLIAIILSGEVADA